MQILRDRYFDDPSTIRNNQATVAYINQIAATEGLALIAELGNPTLGGIHAKLIRSVSAKSVGQPLGA